MEIGDKFPEFELQDENGEIVKSSDLNGIRYIIYFYPKDNTSGCTREAIDFTSVMPKLMMRNIPIFGVSRDSAKTHKGFMEKQSLKIKLLSDPNHSLTESVGAWGKKMMYGKETEGVIRSTFIVSKDGSVEAIWSKVKVDGHVEKVAEKAIQLSKDV